MPLTFGPCIIKRKLKVQKLIQRLDQLTTYVKDTNTLAVKYRINDSFYLEKIEELQVLVEQLEGVYERFSLLQDKIEQEYKSVFCCWQADVRWLSRQQLIFPSNC